MRHPFRSGLVEVPSYYPRDTIDIDIAARDENLPRKFQIQQSQPAWNLHRSRRSIVPTPPCRFERDYNTVLYIRVSGAFLNIRSNPRVKFGSAI
jgi:hypothetical protein